MKREQFLTIVLTIVAVIATYVVLKPRVEDTQHAHDGFGANARPVYVEGSQRAPAHSADDAIDANTNLEEFTGSADDSKKNAHHEHSH